MDLQEAEGRVRGLMVQHGLSDWTFRWDRAIRRFGYCLARQKVISLSQQLVALNEWPQVENTILHEVAHAIAGPGIGHGRAWKEIALRIGCTGERCYNGTEVRTPAAKFIGACPGCGVTVQRNRRKRIACSRCCKTHANGYFDARFLFRWSENKQTEGGDMTKDHVAVRKYKGKTFRLVVEKQKDGSVKYYLGSKNGKVFRSPSSAAQAVTGVLTSGWGWWHLKK
jgi:predicted SprT family Zn-dependent metalloprotease